MFNTEQEKIRIEKLKKLREKGINPYPYSFSITHKFKELKENFEELEGKEVQSAGRIMSIRRHGKSTFMTLKDSTENLQIYFRKDIVGDENYEIMKLLDIGDIIGVKGELFKTHTGEITILIKEFQLLAKSLHPLPEKWHGLKDVETRYRRRYLDILMNDDVKKIIETRSRIIKELRNFLDSKGFIEIETPILQPLYGGAFANPFKTYYEALDREYYLRISDELYLKRLIVAGFDKVYEIGKDFRNEGIDRMHNPEFTQLEVYEAYTDYNGMMKLAEEIFSYLSDIFGSKLKFEDKETDLRKGFKKIKYLDAIKEYAGINPEDKGEVLKLAKELEIRTEGVPFGKILDKIFDLKVVPNLIDPTFVIDYPKDISPLAKTHRENPNLTERFEIFILGIELGNAFSELNDPLDQYERFKNQAEYRKMGDKEAHPLDEDFIFALEIGMPPLGGLGIGIDRLCMLFTGATSIREVIPFPQLKTK